MLRIVLCYLLVSSLAFAQHSHNSHNPGDGKFAEHEAAFDLVLDSDVTHRAVSSGPWFNASTWQGSQIPGNNARVLIPANTIVTYNGTSNNRLFTLRVDGELTFSTQQNTRMFIDTLIVAPTGSLVIGTEGSPVRSNVSAEIVIADNGPIDVNWDPMLLSRGVIVHGRVRIHGHEKTVHLKVASDPQQGDTSVTLAEPPVSWQLGDTIVIAGTHYKGYSWDNDIRQTRHFLPEDDVRTITGMGGVGGTTITLNQPLEFDHSSPRADLKTSVANYTRNVRFVSENTDTARRGHFMVMHNDDADIRYAEFFEMGRTDKSVSSENVGEITPVTSTSNARGRYPFHFHRTGLEDVRNPAIAVGNAVFGSPGWGYVHHDANAVFHNNASYNTFGAGFVAETGNEIGTWTNNIAIYAKGIQWGNPKNAVNLGTFDTANSGDGFWFQGRMVRSVENIAASVNHGYAYFHRNGDNGMINFTSDKFMLPEALGWPDRVSADDAPILSFKDNETFAANSGMIVVKANPNQGHDIHSHLVGLKAWSVRSGGHIEYTSHYILEDFDVVGKRDVAFSRAGTGLTVGNNTTDVTFINPRVTNFPDGIIAQRSFNFDLTGIEPEFNIINPTFTNVAGDQTRNFDRVLSWGQVSTGRFNLNFSQAFTYMEGWPDPNARRVAVNGTKTDSIGAIAIPAGSDGYDGGFQEVIWLLNNNGYYENNDGRRYFILEDYYSDRVTGEIHKEGKVVELNLNVPVGSQFHSYRDATDNGQIDLNSQAPVVSGELSSTSLEQDVDINLTSNDSDPDGDTIRVDGIVQPQHGVVFDNGDGTVTYRPDFDFIGTDTFKYWVTDGFGNFSPAVVRVTVTDGAVPPPSSAPSRPLNLRINA